MVDDAEESQLKGPIDVLAPYTCNESSLDPGLAAEAAPFDISRVCDHDPGGGRHLRTGGRRWGGEYRQAFGHLVQGGADLADDNWRLGHAHCLCQERHELHVLGHAFGDRPSCR
jgi:hypothetical protein